MKMELRVLAEYIQEAYEDADQVRLIHALMEPLRSFDRLELIAQEMEWLQGSQLEQVAKKADELKKEYENEKPL